MARLYERSGLLLATIAILTIYILYTHTSSSSSFARIRSSYRGGGAAARPQGATQEVSYGNTKISIISMSSEENSYTVLSLANKFSYANKQGYDLRIDYEGEGGAWHKMTMVEEQIRLQKYDWIWWIDFDTLFTNKTIRITDIVDEVLASSTDPDKISMIFTPDCFPMNTGSMLYRGKDPSILEFIDFVRKCGKDHDDMSDQDCIRDAVGVQNDPNPKQQPVVSEKWSKRFSYVQQHKINAFPDEIGCVEAGSRQWRSGDFLIHFAGAWAHVKDPDARGLLMRKYAPSIVG